MTMFLSYCDVELDRGVGDIVGFRQKVMLLVMFFMLYVVMSRSCGLNEPWSHMTDSGFSTVVSVVVVLVLGAACLFQPQ